MWTRSLLLLAVLAIAPRAHAVHDFVGQERRRAPAANPLAVAQDEQEKTIFALEAEKAWAQAANAWKKRQIELSLAATRRPELRPAQRKALYRYVICVTRYGVETSRATYTRRAANVLIRLEKSDPTMDGMRKHYEQLLQDEPALHAAYVELKAKK